MTDASFTFTDRARPIVEVAIGDSRVPVTPGRWDVSRWDAAAAQWWGSEWLDVSCDVRSYTCEYGRARTTDRYVAGQATVVVDNASGWADPMATQPAILQMRPGREIRLGVWHAVYGTRWLFRGFIDSVVPTYEPVDVDTVTFQCLDALGEVNRAKVKPLAAPAYAGERADQRIARILDLASWDPTKRDLWGTSDTLVADELGGQVADLLGQAADSAGGVVFGNTDGYIAFRPRDWQTYTPGAPDDGTIGNVEPGHVIPGVPQVDGYLVPTVGIASTPDAADLVITGDIRVTARVRDDSAEAGVSRYVVFKAGGATRSYTMLATFGVSSQQVYASQGYPTGATSPATASTVGARSTFGLTPPGVDRYIGATHTGVTPGSQAVNLQALGLTSSDGLTWTPTGTTPAKVRADAISFDDVSPLWIGQGWQGRIYWAQVEAINRARLVFPGVTGNYCSVPDAAPLRVTGDIELVARMSMPDWTFANPIAVVAARDAAGPNRGWHLSVTATGGFRFAASADGTTSPTVVNSTAHGFVDGSTYWLKATRVAATGAVSLYSAPDSETEPTVWTARGTGSTPAGGIVAGNAPLTIATRLLAPTEVAPMTVRRFIMRNGIAGTAVLDVSENNAGVMATASTFVASSGQTVTVAQTGAYVIVQPQADAVVWRFDANDYPGTGTSYVDPRGRTWTLSAAGAIVPKVPAIDAVVVPADICPISWTRPFDRAGIATRVIVGRSAETAQVFDDLAAQDLYGIEPFERTDLLTELDARIAQIGQRFLATRGASTAPRVRSVSFDAATSPDALDLMTSVDVFRPSRYRCRLNLERGEVFDEEMFATAVAHSVEPRRWTLELNLDAASPFAVAGVRWDYGWWDQSAWANVAARASELLELVQRIGVSA